MHQDTSSLRLCDDLDLLAHACQRLEREGSEFAVKTLLVANDGGHFVELTQLLPRLPITDDLVWVTVPTPQTESLLAGQQVHWVSPAVTRDYRAVARNASLIRPLLRKHKFRYAVSTGSSLALSALPQASVLGIECHYIESATRCSRPSVSGRLLSYVPTIHTHTQCPDWANWRWNYAGTVFSAFEVKPSTPCSEIRSVVVSLGTSEKYQFRRMVEQLVKILPPDADVLWQTGSTDVSGLPIEARQRVPQTEMEAAMRAADVVVSHAGTGVTLSALNSGKMPVLLPRRPEFDEHVDDHQLQIADEMDRLGLALVREVDSLTEKDLLEAASAEVVRPEKLPAFDWHAKTKKV